MSSFSVKTPLETMPEYWFTMKFRVQRAAKGPTVFGLFCLAKMSVCVASAGAVVVAVASASMELSNVVGSRLSSMGAAEVSSGIGAVVVVGELDVVVNGAIIASTTSKAVGSKAGLTTMAASPIWVLPI